MWCCDDVWVDTEEAAAGARHWFLWELRLYFSFIPFNLNNIITLHAIYNKNFDMFSMYEYFYKCVPFT